MGKNKLPNIQITELFLVKAGNDWTRTYMGNIKREIDADGNPVVFGSVIVEEGEIWSIAAREEQLGKNLDEICIMKLDYGLHIKPVRKFNILGMTCFLN